MTTHNSDLEECGSPKHTQATGNNTQTPNDATSDNELLNELKPHSTWDRKGMPPLEQFGRRKQARRTRAAQQGESDWEV